MRERTNSAASLARRRKTTRALSAMEADIDALYPLISSFGRPFSISEVAKGTGIRASDVAGYLNSLFIPSGLVRYYQGGAVRDGVRYVFAWDYFDMTPAEFDRKRKAVLKAMDRLGMDGSGGADSKRYLPLYNAIRRWVEADPHQWSERDQSDFEAACATRMPITTETGAEFVRAAEILQSLQMDAFDADVRTEFLRARDTLRKPDEEPIGDQPSIDAFAATNSEQASTGRGVSSPA